MDDHRKAEAEARPDKPVPVSSPAYRPKDYFGRFDEETALLTHVKGRMRRAAIRNAIARGELDLLPPEFLAAELSAEDRAGLGGMHPAFMGGEYLPRMRAGEVEIARVSINSTTCDVTTVYARPVGRRIAYRVIDEYDGDTLDAPTTRTSVRPLTMGELLDFFLGAWNLFECLEANFDGDVQGMLGFFRAESEFYPGLDDAIRERVEERYPPREDDEDDEDQEDAS